MPRIYASMTKTFYEIVKGYAEKRGLTESAALVELAGKGYEAAEGQQVQAVPAWGGDRKSKHPCPECGSTNTGYWADRTWMCDDCEHAFEVKDASL